MASTHSGAGVGTYSGKVSFGVVLLPSVKIFIDCDEAAASAAAELGLEAEDGDSVFRGLEPLADLCLDGGPLHASHLGVDQLNNLHTHESLESLRGGGERTHCFLPRRGFTIAFRM